MFDLENKVVYGIYDLRPQRQEALGHFQYLYSDYVDIRKRYVSLGFHIDEFERLKYFEDFGFPSMPEFMLANFGLDKSAYSRCVNVWRRFCDRQDSSRKMWLSDKYSAYNYSQLVEMLPLSDNQLKRVEPGMSVKQIRQIKHVPYVPDNLLDNFKSFCNGFLGKKPVTRSNLLAVFISCGKSHFGGSCSGYYYSFSLNKLSFGDSYSDYYAFDDWLNFYDSRIGFEPDPDGDSSCDVATDDKMTIDDYQKYKGVVLSNKIKSAGSLETVALDIYDDSGARIQSLQADVLLNSAGALVVRLVKQ